ncbi:MAG: polysaccharide deacetylase family protein [Firmicutes bacterium]|nr:polysaccharide deacetylase family protein [Bacillota bacterium]
MGKKIITGKTISLLLVVLLAVLLCSCGVQKPADEIQEVSNEVLEEYIAEINRYETPEGVFEYENSYIVMEEDFVVRILYPVTGNAMLDKEIEEYVNQIADEHKQETLQTEAYDGQPAELTAEYLAHVSEGQLASVKLTGVYNAPFMAHPYDIIKTFNGRLDGEEMMTIRDVVHEDKLEELARMTADAASVTEEYNADELLECWIVTEEGLEITLERGRFGPMSDGTRVVSFTFEQLKGMLAEGIGPAETEPAPEDGAEDIPVILPQQAEIDPDKPMVAITFDDGPGAYTERLLDIFEEHGGKGTFFLVGNQVSKRTETVQRIVADGHEVAGHSWNHRQLTKLTDEELEDQFMKPRAAIYKATGVDPVIMRPPYGSYNDDVKAVAKELGISAINWNVDTLDWKNKNVDAVYKACMDGLKDGNIILCHDIHKTTVDAMEKVIPAILEEGYQLVTVSQLLTAEGGGLEPGKLYFGG